MHYHAVGFCDWLTAETKTLITSNNNGLLSLLLTFFQ